MPECGVCRRRWWDERGEAEWARQRCNVMVVEVEQPQLAPLSLPLLRMSTEECSRAIRFPAGQRERLDSTRLDLTRHWAVEDAPHLTPHASRCTASQPRSLKLVGNSSRKQLAGSTRGGSAQIDVAQRSTLALFGSSFVVRERAAASTPNPSHQEILSPLLLLGPSRFFLLLEFRRTNTFCRSSFNLGLLLLPLISSTSNSRSHSSTLQAILNTSHGEGAVPARALHPAAPAAR